MELGGMQTVPIKVSNAWNVFIMGSTANWFSWIVKQDVAVGILSVILLNFCMLGLYTLHTHKVPAVPKLNRKLWRSSKECYQFQSKSDWAKMIKSKSIKILECHKISIQIQVHVRLWSFSFIGHTKDKGVNFFQKDWARLVEMTESERGK